MGYPLFREVKQHAPADLDTGELALLLILADEANDETRECFPGMDELCAHMRMTADGIGRILQRLAKHGIDVRVPVGKDKTGRLLYAVKGVRTTYRLPRFAPPMAGPQSAHKPDARTTVRPKDPQCPDASPAMNAQCPDQGPPISHLWPDASPSMAGPQSGPSPQSPQEEDPHLLPSQRILRNAGLGLTEDEEKKIIDWANKDKHKGPAWWRKLAANGDLPDLIARWRSESAQGPGIFGNAPPPWCGHCNDGADAARFNTRFRLIDGQPCPTCHPSTYARTAA